MRAQEKEGQRGEFLNVGTLGGLKNKISARRDGEKEQHHPNVPGRCGRC